MEAVETELEEQLRASLKGSQKKGHQKAGDISIRRAEGEGPEEQRQTGAGRIPIRMKRYVRMRQTTAYSGPRRGELTR